MSVIVGLVDGAGMHLGADSRVTIGDHEAAIGARPKVTQRDQVLIGATGATLMADLIVHALVIPPILLTCAPERLADEMLTLFSLNVRELADDHLVTFDGDSEQIVYTRFIVLLRGRMFYGWIGPQGREVREVGHHRLWFAIGCAADYAMGAIWAVRRAVPEVDCAGPELVRVGLEAACHYDVHCAEPLTILTLPSDSKSTL